MSFSFIPHTSQQPALQDTESYHQFIYYLDIIDIGIQDGTFESPKELIAFLNEWKLNKDPRILKVVSQLIRASTHIYTLFFK